MLYQKSVKLKGYHDTIVKSACDLRIFSIRLVIRNHLICE